MRLSVEDNDPGHCALAHKALWPVLWHIAVFLDGEKVQAPVTADDELGYVKYFLYGFGKPVCGDNALGECCQLTVERFGVVRIEVAEE